MPDRVVTYAFRGNFSNLGAGLAAMGRNIDATATKLTALDKNGAKMRAGLTAIGDTGGKVGLAFAAGVGLAVGASANFEQAMSNVQAATHETADNMGLLRQAALDAGAATKYSASEAAGAIENLAKAGVSTADILAGGLDGALNLAAAGGIEVADAAEVAATAMTQFGLAGADIPHVADLLAAAAGKAVGEVSDYGAALNQSGLIADQVGLSIEETTGALAAFGSASLLGSDAGTSFKTMLGALTPNSAKARDLMNDLGISAYDAQGNFIGLAEFAGVLQGALSDMTDEQRQATLETIFGSDAVRAASVLYEQGASGIQSWINKVDDQGYAAETAATKMDNLKGDLEELGGALETAFIGAGSGSQGMLRDLTQGLTGAVNVFNDLPSSAQNTATALAGITAVTGGSLWFGSRVINGIANTKQALSDLGWTAETTNGKLKGLAVAGGGIVVLTAGLIGAAEAIERLNGGFDTGSLDRDFAALAGGDVTENMDSLVDSLETLRKAGSVPALADLSGEVATLFGLFGNTNVDQAAQDIKALDEYLAALVESGNADVAAQHFNALVEGLAKVNHTQPERVLDDVTDMLSQYDTALENAAATGGVFSDFMSGLSSDVLAAAGAASDGTAATNDFGGSMRQSAQAAAAEAAAIRDSIDAMRDKRTATLAAFDAETSYRQALKDARAQADKNNAGVKGNTDEVLANRSALSQLAGAWNNQSSAVKNNVERYQDARRSFIQTAEAMGVPTAAARRLANQILEIPKSRVANIGQNGAEDATRQVQRLNAELARVASKSITISANVVRNGLSGLGFASGGLVRGPGGPKDDLIPAWLSDREYVMPTEAVDYYGLPMMEMLRMRQFSRGEFARARGDAAHLRSRLGLLQGMQPVAGYANGGPVGAHSSIYDRRREVQVQAYRSAAQNITVNAPSLAGLRIEGRVDVDGREGYLRGIIRDEIDGEKRFDRVRRGE